MELGKAKRSQGREVAAPGVDWSPFVARGEGGRGGRSQTPIAFGVYLFQRPAIPPCARLTAPQLVVVSLTGGSRTRNDSTVYGERRGARPRGAGQLRSGSLAMGLAARGASQSGPPCGRLDWVHQVGCYLPTLTGGPDTCDLVAWCTRPPCAARAEARTV